MSLNVGGAPKLATQQPKSLPVNWDVALDAKQVEFVDLDRSEAKANLTLNVPLSKLGLTKQEAKKLFEGAELQWIAPGKDAITPKVTVKGDTLVVKAEGIDGRGFFGAAPRLAMKDKDGIVRVMTFRTPTATLKEKDPDIRSGWGGSGIKEHLQAQKAAWKSTKEYFRDLKHEIKDTFEGAEKRQQLKGLRELKQQRRETHRNALHEIRSDRREQRHDRKEAERADRKGLNTVTTNQR